MKEKDLPKEVQEQLKNADKFLRDHMRHSYAKQRASIEKRRPIGAKD
jgi:hypothetical protein